MRPPSQWGTKARLDELFATHEVRATKREFMFRYRSPLHFVEVMRTFYGPMHKTFGALDADNQAAFTRDLVALMEQHNRARDRTLVVPSEYLEVVITKKA